MTYNNNNNHSSIQIKKLKKRGGFVAPMHHQRCLNPSYSQYAPLQMIFAVKQDLRCKAQLVLGGHVIDASGHNMYASNMKGISSRILMLIAAANNDL